jgi:mRNA interferase RelE/StbE
MHELIWSGRAEKAFKRLPTEVQRRMRKATEELKENPRPAGVEKLHGKMEGLWRIRVGLHHRVLYEIEDANQRITILNVGSREGIYG